MPRSRSSTSHLVLGERLGQGVVVGRHEDRRAAGRRRFPPRLNRSVFSDSEFLMGDGTHRGRSRPPQARGSWRLAEGAGACSHGGRVLEVPPGRRPLGRLERLAEGYAAGGQVADGLGDDADVAALHPDELAVDRLAVPGHDDRRRRDQAEHEVEASAATRTGSSPRRTRARRLAPPTPRPGRPRTPRRRPGTRTTRSPPVWPRPGCTSSTARSPRSTPRGRGERVVGGHDPGLAAPRRACGSSGSRR